MIKVKEGYCLDCSRVTKLIAKRCNSCYWKHRSNTKKKENDIKGVDSKKTKIYRIAKLSSKRKVQNVLYLKKRRTFMEQNKMCQAKLFGCTHVSTDLHHIKGRVGELLTDENNFLALCRSCHTIIEENPKFAKEKEFSRSRLDIFL